MSETITTNQRKQTDMSENPSKQETGQLVPFAAATCSMPKKRIVSEETFRNHGRLNEDDDMVRVTLDMRRTVWWAWKRKRKHTMVCIG